MSQEWMGGPPTGPGAEGPTSLAELDPQASALASTDGWAAGNGAAASVEADPAAGASAADSLQASAASVELLPGDAAAVAAAQEEGGREAGARGALREVVRRLTPGWLSPRVRGLALLWLLVALVATNWCVRTLPLWLSSLQHGVCSRCIGRWQWPHACVRLLCCAQGYALVEQARRSLLCGAGSW